jgi:large subunit ribosomal protein L15
VGRGPGSGLGKTSGRGEKGQKSRSGYSRKVGFEGGQMPLHRRVPKRGFTNPFRKEYAEVNLERLEAFEAGTIVTPEVLREHGLVKSFRDGVKILARGKLTKALTVRAHKFSAKAQEEIGKAGGKAEVIEG